MAKTERINSVEDRTRELLSAGTAAELRLLKQERRAEGRLAEALARLEVDQQRLARSAHRVERSRSAVDEAAAALQERQEQRAAGPTTGRD